MAYIHYKKNESESVAVIHNKIDTVIKKYQEIMKITDKELEGENKQIIISEVKGIIETKLLKIIAKRLVSQFAEEQRRIEKETGSMKSLSKEDLFDGL